MYINNKQYSKSSTKAIVHMILLRFPIITKYKLHRSFIIDEKGNSFNYLPHHAISCLALEKLHTLTEKSFSFIILGCYHVFRIMLDFLGYARGQRLWKVWYWNSWWCSSGWMIQTCYISTVFAEPLCKPYEHIC